MNDSKIKFELDKELSYLALLLADEDISNEAKQSIDLLLQLNALLQK